MAAKIETRATAEYLISESANIYRSRGVGTVAAAAALLAGTVLGQILGAPTAAGSEAAGNVGTSTITDAPTVTKLAKPGRYVFTQLNTAGTGALQVTDPDGAVVGHGNVGTAITTIPGITSVTVTGGGTPTAGDQFYLDVSFAESGNYVLHDPEATDGSQHVAAILFEGVAAGETVERTLTLRDSEVTAAHLTWKTGITDNQKAAGLAELAALGIIVR